MFAARILQLHVYKKQYVLGKKCIRNMCIEKSNMFIEEKMHQYGYRTKTAAKFLFKKLMLQLHVCKSSLYMT